MVRPSVSIWLVSVAVGLGLGLDAARPASAARVAQWRPATTLRGLSIELGAGELQALVEADGVIEHRVYVIEPLQVVLDIMNVRNPLEGQRPKEPHPLLGQVSSQELPMIAYDRAAPREKTFARFTFELKKPVWHSIRVEPGRLELRLHSQEQKSSDGGPVETSEAQAPTPSEASPFPAQHRIEPSDVDPNVFFGAAPGEPDQYRIGPEDLIEIRVFELEQLNRTGRVEADGNVNLPLIGAVNVRGLTAPEAAERVARKLREFVDDPQVSVLITEYYSRRVSLLGAVARPGAYPLMGQRDLLELLAESGGLGPGAGSVLYVFRRLPDGRGARLSVPLNELLVRGDPRWNVRLQPGDVVSIPLDEAISVSVVGAVASPGVYKLPASEGATLLRAIALSGGLKPRASKSIQIKRQSSSGEETILKVDFGDILSGKKADVVLEEGDVVIVKRSFF